MQSFGIGKFKTYKFIDNLITFNKFRLVIAVINKYGRERCN